MRTSVACGAGVLTVAVMWAGTLAGTPSAHETLVKEMLEAVDKITKELTAITNTQTAQDARPKLKEAAARLLDLRKKADDAKQPSKEEKDRIAKQYKERFDGALKKLRDETVRVRGIEGGEEALKEIAVINKKKPKK